MKKNTLMLCVLAFAAVALSGCGKEESVSFNTLESARAQGLENAVTNAKAYVRENPRMAGMDVVGHVDSTQTATCPQGDGWASLSVMKEDKTRIEVNSGKTVMEKYKIKCSTVSANLGCYLEEDFKSKSFAAQEGKCDATLPFPLPKVVGK
jgi:hypothetical protein